MRVLRQDGDMLWALVPGRVLMQVVGFADANLPSCRDEALMKSFAGNAFSGFTVGSVLASMVAVWRLPISARH